MMDLPGFYYDPEKNKYFRLTRDQQQGISTTAKRRTTEVFNSCKSIKLLNILQMRETSLRKNENFDMSFAKLINTSSLKIREDIPSSLHGYVDDILYVRGGHKSLFGLWKMTRRFSPSVGEIFTGPPESHPIHKHGKISYPGILDFCDGFADSELLLVIANDLVTQSGKIQIHCREHFDATRTIRHDLKQSPVWCCCSNSFTSQFAVGSENFFCLINNNQFHMKYIPGNVHAVEFSDDGHLLYCGLNSGQLIVVDLRSSAIQSSKDMFNHRGIGEIHQLSNQNRLLCASFNGDLCQYDLRQMEMTTYYLNHVHTPKKAPISFSEQFNLLCATGTDNITRLWSLGGGLPVKTIHPPNQDEQHQAWLESNASSASVYIFQKNLFYSCNLYDLPNKD